MPQGMVSLLPRFHEWSVFYQGFKNQSGKSMEELFDSQTFSGGKEDFDGWIKSTK